MKILIVENERPAAERLVRLLNSIDDKIIVPAVTETVESTINWLRTNDEPDLILMDIMLDDGLCFEIFETIKVDIPVIFITAFDDYTLRAFKVNSVDYLLKPVEESPMRAALQKFRRYHGSAARDRSAIGKALKELTPAYKTRFLVKSGTRYRSIPVVEIKFFHITERNVFLRDQSGKDYGLDHSLEQVQKFLNPDNFFRINRECIINLDSISVIQSYSSSRLQINVVNEKENDLFIVSREKVTEFKRWIDR
jgi:DNA-binding LytR/AlgR family response regulator